MDHTVAGPCLTPLEILARNSLDRTCNSNIGVRVSRLDDTNLDGTTQVPGQSPELTAWLTKNLGHPTGEQRHAFYDPPSTLQYLLGALGTRGQQAGARENENQVENLLSGDPITCRILRLASTPLPPRTTATLNVHSHCRQDHAVNVHLPGCQPVNGHPWPPSPTELQQVLFHFRTKPAPHLLKPHIHTKHSTQPTHIGLTTAYTTNTHMIRTDPKSTR
ncbi:hypothetical protein Taro_038062, partial [Colocasia esculenta]|nr:hypothetical protein [Colocasia esculenta]